MTGRLQRSFHLAIGRVRASPHGALHMHLHSNALAVAYAAFLESIETGQDVPDGCDKDYLRSRQWADRDSAGWHLTEKGREHLRRWGGEPLASPPLEH